jgi:hypothetical protein
MSDRRGRRTAGTRLRARLTAVVAMGAAGAGALVTTAIGPDGTGALASTAIGPDATGALASTSIDRGGSVAATPERGLAVVLEPVSGRVFVHADGVTTYRRLRGKERMPVGTTVDAKRGAVRLTVARDERGGIWTAVFSEGKFTVLQPDEDDPVTTLELTGASLRETCGGDTATASAKRKKRVRRLWGDGKGRFRTSGHYSAATVRGTRWLTEDRCDGTLTRVVRGSVEVEDFTTVPDTTPVPEAPERGTPEPPAAAPAPATGEAGSVVVPAGGSYVARPGH